MAKIDLNRFGGVRGTKLTPEDLDGDAAVLTISEYAEQRNTGEGRRLSPVLRYSEAPEKLHYLNREQMERLVAKLGDDSDRWIGKRVPVAVEDVVYEGETFHKVYVMRPEEWEQAFKDAGLGEKSAPAAEPSRRRRGARA